MSSSDSSDDDPLCIHATVKITGDQCKFETKILLHNDGKEKFVDVINSVLTEYAHTSVDADSSAGEEASAKIAERAAAASKKAKTNK